MGLFSGAASLRLVFACVAAALFLLSVPAYFAARRPRRPDRRECGEHPLSCRVHRLDDSHHRVERPHLTKHTPCISAMLPCRLTVVFDESEESSC